MGSTTWAWLILCLGLGLASARAQGLAPDSGSSLMRREFADRMPDPVLINQRGEHVHFFSDLVQSQAVVINFFYAECKGSCPTTNLTIRRLRSELARTFGRSIRFLSITLEAEKDTPEVIARYAAVHGGESADPDIPDWQFLTGDPGEIRALRKHLGMSERDPALDADPRQHAAMLVVGNHATGRWSKVNPLVRPAMVREKVERIAGWTQSQRYADIRRAVNESRPSGLPPVLLAEPPPILGTLSQSLTGTERAGNPVNTESLRGKAIVFGRIYTICPHGSEAVVNTLHRLNEAFGSSGRLQLVALAPASDRETPEFFQTFASLASVSEQDPWWFVTAGPDQVDAFTVAGLGLRPPRSIPEEERIHPLEDTEHDLRLVLVDPSGQIRGRYEVFQPDPTSGDASANQLEADVRSILQLP